MIITKKSLPRRTFLRGMGASLALPLLDAMIPAATAASATAALPVKRLGYIFMPMGCDIGRWTPGGTDGKLGELSPILKSLESVKSHVTAITNLELRTAYPGSHATSNAAFLSAAKAKHTESSDYYLGTTADQIAAQQIGHATQLPSLELSMDMLQTTGQCDNGYACVYQNNLSWSSPTTPLPSEAHPRIVFERLFGEGGSLAERQAALRKRASLLDWITEDIASLRRNLGPADRAKVAEYLDTVREVERRIQKAEADVAKNNLPADLDRPLGVPASYADHARLMFDLQVLAMQGDITRVTTFQLARETSNRTYVAETGVADPHHPLSHHGNDESAIQHLLTLETYQILQFNRFLTRLAGLRDGGGSLLDATTVLFGSGIGDANTHKNSDLPVILAGGGYRHGEFKRLPASGAGKVPLCNLFVDIAQRMGLETGAFGTSTGRFA
jgi:hypothetical protein